MLLAVCMGQEQWNCPPRTVIYNGVCSGKDGKSCTPTEAQSPVCYDFDAEYTEAAAKASVKGTVRLATTVGTDGCAHNIKVISSLGYGLDEAAVSALERWRFRRTAKAVSTIVEFNFDPTFTSRTPATAPKCIDQSNQNSPTGK
jgi:TonB family protein